MFTLDGQPFDIDAPHTIGDVHYPFPWFHDPANRAAIGVIESSDPAPEPPGPTELQVVAAYMALVQRYMDERAATFGYDNLLSVVTYAEEPAVERYQNEGKAFRAWRSACWAKCEEVLASVKAGERPAPNQDELLAELPELGLEYSGPFAS